MYPVHIKPFDALTPAEYLRITRAREAVFFLEQRVPVPDADSVDARSVFFWMEDTERVVAFLRLIPAGVVYPEVSVGRVLVDAACRRQGLCRRLMDEALHYVETEWGPQPIRISAQRYIADFYAALGFEPVTDVYTEAGIPHIGMLRP